VCVGVGVCGCVWVGGIGQKLVSTSNTLTQNTRLKYHDTTTILSSSKWLFHIVYNISTVNL